MQDIAHAQTENFRRNLAAVCADRGSIQRIADRAAIHRVYLSKVLHGHAIPSIEVAARIADAAGLSLAAIFRNPKRSA